MNEMKMGFDCVSKYISGRSLRNVLRKLLIKDMNFRHASLHDPNKFFSKKNCRNSDGSIQRCRIFKRTDKFTFPRSG